VVVTRFVPSSGSVELVRDLGASDFTAQLGSVPATIAGASIDSGPKRIALILDGRESPEPSSCSRISRASFIGVSLAADVHRPREDQRAGHEGRSLGRLREPADVGARN
jgi:hypothetical protein